MFSPYEPQKRRWLANRGSKHGSSDYRPGPIIGGRTSLAVAERLGRGANLVVEYANCSPKRPFSPSTSRGTVSAIPGKIVKREPFPMTCRSTLTVSSTPYRTASVLLQCGRCDRKATLACPRCGYPLCEDHLLAPGELCAPCEATYAKRARKRSWLLFGLMVFCLFSFVTAADRHGISHFGRPSARLGESRLNAPRRSGVLVWRFFVGFLSRRRWQ